MKLKVEIIKKVEMNEQEEAILNTHIEEIKSQYKNQFGTLTVEVSENEKGDFQVDWTFNAEKFERIRRITGYLVGTVDRWNNGKQAELYDRVKHSVA